MDFYVKICIKTWKFVFGKKKNLHLFTKTFHLCKRVAQMLWQKSPLDVALKVVCLLTGVVYKGHSVIGLNTCIMYWYMNAKEMFKLNNFKQRLLQIIKKKLKLLSSCAWSKKMVLVLENLDGLCMTIFL